jgi:glycosyltransferase involved in cell wall biosynthesis
VATLPIPSDSVGKVLSALFLISNLGLGGAERQLVYLAVGLRQRGWEVTVASLSPLVHPEFEALLKANGVSLEVLQDRMSASVLALGRALRAAVALVKRRRPSAIVGFMPHGALFARSLGRAMRVPRIVTSLRSIRSTRTWHDGLLAATRSIDNASVANSSAAAKAQVAAGVIDGRKCRVIYNGFQLDEARPTGGDRERPVPFTWLHVAVFRTEKGHANLLHAAAIMARERPFRLLLAGEGPRLEDMKALAAELGLGDRVGFLGKRTDVASLLHVSNAFVLPSMYEGLPNALMEALAAGVPAVATDAGGTPEVLRHGEMGYLVPPEDPDSLAAAMLRMMDMRRDERRAMGERGRAHVLRTFAMGHMVDQWERVLAE